MSFPNGQGLPTVQIYEDSTCTSARVNPANNNSRFVLQPLQQNNLPTANGAILPREAAGFGNPFPQPILAGQENLSTFQPVPHVFNHNAWLVQNTTPGAPTTVAGLSPQQLQAAQNTTFVSIGQPVNTITTPHGYQIVGIWHMGHLQQSIQNRQQRPAPGVNPFWTANILQQQDATIRAGNGVSGMTWPTRAVGMTMHIPTIQTAAQNGMYITDVNRRG